MRTLSDSRRFGRLGSGFCMIAAPLTLLVGALLHPDSGDSASAHVAAIADDPSRNYVSHTLILVGLALLLGAILGLVHLIRERSPAVANLGGVFGTVGVLGATSIVAVDGLAFTQIGNAAADAEQMAALLDRIMESSGARAIAIVGALSFLFGMLALAYGLWRTRVARAWTPPAVAAAALAFFVGQVSDEPFIFALAFVLYLIGLAPLGWAALRESDEEWAGDRAQIAAS